MTFTGLSFTGATGVLFDSAAATSFSVVNDTTITAVAPAHAAGAVATSVVTTRGTSSLPAGYTYNALPTSPVILSPAQGAATTTLPVYSGTFSSAGSTITVVVDGVSIGAVTPASGVAWSLQQPTALTGGAHTVYATATTASGGVSAPSATTNFTVDATAPSAPVVTAPVSGSHTGDTTPTFTGTAEANATITISANSVVQATTAVNGSGAWSVDLPVQADAQYIYRVTATDAAGNVSPQRSVTLRIDTVAPVTPTLTAPANNGPASASMPTFSGTGEPFTGINLKLNGDTYVSGIGVDGSGNWTFSFPGFVASGTYVATVTNEDYAGNVSPLSNARTFTLDRIAPVVQSSAPEFQDAAQVTTKVFLVTFNEAISTAVAGDFSLTTTGTATGAISGVAISGAEVRVTVSGLAGEGTIRVNVPAANAIKDNLGNGGGVNGTTTAAYSTGSVHVVDTIAPGPATLIAPADGAVVNTSTPVVIGTAEAGSTVILYVDTFYFGQTLADGSGNFSFTLSTQADGTHTLQFQVRDAALNATSISAATNFTVDTTAPATPVIVIPTEGSTSVSRSVVLSGTAESNATVLLILDGATRTLTASNTSQWTYTATNLADGAHSFTVQARDGAGLNSPVSAARNFTVDATAPVAPTVTSPANGSTTQDTTPTLSGTAEAGAVLTITLDGATAGTATADGSGGWSFTTAILADGGHTASVVATDPAGNVSPSSGTISFTVDALAPASPTIAAPANGSTTADNTPTITGTAEAGSTVTVTLDVAPAGAVTADGSGVWSLTATALADGSHTVSAISTDAVGNVSPTSGTVTFTIDASAPAAPVISAPVEASTTADNTPTISGTAEAGSTVTITIDGATVGMAAADGSGSWSFTSTALADGAHTVRAAATDAVGNASPNSGTITFMVDATAPAVPVISAPVDGSVTDDGTPTVSGTAENGSTVRLSINGAATVTVPVSGGAWTYTPPSNLPTGQNTLSATAVDAAGNVSPASATVRFTYSPVTITTTSLPSGQVGVAYSATIQVSGGTGPHNFAITSGVLPDGLSMSTGGALSGPPTASGTFAFTVTATDANGLSTSQAYSVTIAAPASPTADPGTVQISSASANGPTPIDLTDSVENAASIEIVSPPAWGTVTVNGFQVIYTPQPGFYGSVSFSYRAIGFSNGGPGAASAPATVTITIAPPTLALAGGAQPSGQIGVAYHRVLTASGGTAPYTYAVTGGALPAGITLATDGTLSGSPTAGGTFSFTVTATDSSTGTGPFSVSAVHELTIGAPALTITPPALPNATTAQPYSQTLSTTGGVAPYSYAVTAGALPTGLTLSTGGVLSGTPTQGGAFNFTVSATDSSTGAGPYTAAQAVTLTVTASPIAVTPAGLASGTRGMPYTASMAASGGVAPYTYTIASGALPAGLTLSTTGQISGTPTVVGTFAFQVRATDSATGAGPYSGVVNVTLTIDAASLTVTPTTLPNVLAGVDYSQQLQASGGRGGYTFAVSSGVLPQGLALSPAGLLSGTPTTAGTFAFTVTATDGFGNTGVAPLSVTVIGRPDPSADPDVRGLNTAQAEAARRMVGTQLSNFGRRLEQLHRGGEGQAGATMNLTLDGSALTPLDEGRRTMGELSQARDRDDQEDRDQSARDELNRMVWGDRTGAASTGGPSRDRLNAGPRGGGEGAESSGPRIWAGGVISLGERDATTQSAEMSITTSGISAGVDMSLADNLDLGIGVGFGQENTDVGVDSSRMEADSRVAVAYGSWRPAADVFIDGTLGYGELGFDMWRRTPVDQSMVSGQRDGTATFGSLSAGLDRSVGPARWITYGRVELLNADMDAYTETGSPLWALAYEARSVESLQGALGLRYERDILRGYDRWTPGVRVEWAHEFGDGAAQTLRYADWLGGPGFSIGQEGWARSRFNLGLSLGWRARDGWSWTGEYDGAFSNGEILNGLRIKGSKAF